MWREEKNLPGFMARILFNVITRMTEENNIKFQHFSPRLPFTSSPFWIYGYIRTDLSSYNIFINLLLFILLSSLSTSTLNSETNAHYNKCGAFALFFINVLKYRKDLRKNIYKIWNMCFIFLYKYFSNFFRSNSAWKACGSSCVRQSYSFITKTVFSIWTLLKSPL